MCEHVSVTIYSRMTLPATYYEPAEYEEFARCDECGEEGCPEDFVDAIISGVKDAERPMRGTPSEFYD